MTLYRQLIAAVTLLFTLLYGVSIVTGVSQTRDLLDQQMQVHARDTATSVALSMTQAAQQQDLATLDTMFNAVSDSGYFSRMVYRDLEGKVLLERSFVVSAVGVPQWFIDKIPLSSPKGVAEVSSGWLRLGTLTVTSHPGEAYKKLWHTTEQQLSIFALVTFLVCLVAFFALRVLLRPLSDVEAQAEEIASQQFVTVKKLPRTRELRRVVETMNRMSEQLKSIFEQQLSQIEYLQEQSLRDPVTGLSSRMDFDTRSASLLREERGELSGALMILTVSNMQQVNGKEGRAGGNKVLKAIGEQLQELLVSYPHSIASRRQGPEITLFVPHIIEAEGRELADKVFDTTRQIQWHHWSDVSLVIHMGYSYARSIDDIGNLLSEADIALYRAKENTESCWKSLDEAEQEQALPVLSASTDEWRKILNRAIEEQSIVLHYQPIYSADSKLVAYESYARLPSGNELISAGVFIPMAERFGLVADFDRLVLQTLARQKKEFPKDVYFCANLSLASIQDEGFREWLDQFLKENHSLSKRLVVELSEYAMQVNEQHVRDFSALLLRHNASLAIDHFGLESSAFGYLGSLPLHHIKIHHSFVHNLDSNQDNHFYVQSLVQVARSRNLQLMAEGIERQEEWDTLRELGLDAGQGYLLGRPSEKPVA
ncbi:EAL domain-containing protein [Porticoccus sp. W117]|uniref:bifunctional diguanylate cyclase/phosphodiesterase n=1 Tax=Porticoccus sp. W117 TaxID=3054777 RepID=UPI0025971BF2|nr:EAL domain-containing protein [Porticoccus sp. W117]MDM3872661.1 EAL domain-containing protein [Porticoccus sp. W117]